MELDLIAPETGPLPTARVELSEASGPVSPRFQYQLRLRIVAAGSGVDLLSVARGGRPLVESEVAAPLDRAAYRELWRTLLASSVLEPPGAPPIPHGERRVGVSLNWLELQLGEAPAVRHEYLLTLLRSEEPRDQPLLRAIDAVKRLKPPVAPPAPVAPTEPA